MPQRLGHSRARIDVDVEDKNLDHATFAAQQRRALHQESPIFAVGAQKTMTELIRAAGLDRMRPCPDQLAAVVGMDEILPPQTVQVGQRPSRVLHHPLVDIADLPVRGG